MSNEDREVLTWPQFGSAIRELGRTIVNSGWMPDLVVAVARGGLLPAGALAYAMGLKAIGTMNVEFYTDIAQTLPEPVLIPPLMDPQSLCGKKVLVVDDVADSGKTLAMVMKIVREQGVPSAEGVEPIRVCEARSACIYHKSRSIIVPDYVWKKTDKWINFPWSTLPPVVEGAKADA